MLHIFYQRAMFVFSFYRSFEIVKKYTFEVFEFLNFKNILPFVVNVRTSVNYLSVFKIQLWELNLTIYDALDWY